MTRGLALRSRLRGWPVAGGLAVGSLVPTLPWRWVADAVGGLASHLDVLAPVFIALQPVVGSLTIGLTLAWLLVGWVTYQYAHLVYPDDFEHVVDYEGFCLLTALGTLYFGIVVWGSIVEEAVHVVPVQVLPSTPTAVTLAIVVGFIGGAILFGVYVRRWHPEPLYSEQSDFTAIFDGMMFGDRDYDVDDPRIKASAFAFLPVIICGLVGLVAVILHVFYPLPEGVFVVGLAVQRVWSKADLTASGVPRYELDLRLVDAISGAIRSPKGFWMVLFSVFGMATSGMVFPLFFGFFATEVLVPWSVDQVGLWALRVLFLASSLLAMLIMGSYSLLHWVRQLERIEPYARYWEDTHEEEVSVDGEELSLPTRLPGLLIPAHLPLVSLMVAGVIRVWTGSRPVARGVFIFCSIVAVVVMGWGLMWTRRHHDDPQPLAHESRDLLVTVLIQIGLLMSLFVVNAETLQLNAERGLLGVLLLLVLALFYYVPEVSDWTSRQEGLRKILDVGYFSLLVLLVIVVFRIAVIDSTLLLEGTLISFCVLLLVSTFVEIHRERITE